MDDEKLEIIPQESEKEQTEINPNIITEFDVNSYPLVGIYFSAYWCKPCNKFTPKLADFYNTVNCLNESNTTNNIIPTSTNNANASNISNQNHTNNQNNTNIQSKNQINLSMDNNEMTVTEKKIEIVFLSKDKDEIEFNEYFNKMPWMAVNHGNPLIKTMIKEAKVKGFPLLHVYKNGKLIAANARAEVTYCQGDKDKMFELINKWQNM